MLILVVVTTDDTPAGATFMRVIKFIASQRLDNIYNAASLELDRRQARLASAMGASGQQATRPRITLDVRVAVRQRDSGKCAKCGARERWSSITLRP